MEETKEKQSTLGTWLVVGLSLVLMVVAALLLFVPQIKLIYICYFMCAVTMIAGIYMIVRYFMTDAFKNMNEYGFSIGVLVVILGVCGLLRAEKLAGSFVVILGIALVCSGIIKMQYAMDLKRMNDKIMWYILLAISIAVIAVAVFVILQPFAGAAWFDTTTWYAMLVDGGLGILTVIYMAIRLKLFKKSEIKAAQKAEEERLAAQSAQTESGMDQEATSVAVAADENENVNGQVQTNVDTVADSFEIEVKDTSDQDTL